MHSPSNLWLVAPFLSLVIGLLLLSEGLRRFARPRLVRGRELSKATLFVVRAFLVSTALFLATWAGWLAFGLKR